MFVNIPLSYLIANILFYITNLPFGYLVIGSYWFTNVLGLLFMYYGGKGLIISSKNKNKSIIIMVIFLITYSAIMIYLDKQGKLEPLGLFFKKYYILKW